MGRAGSGTSTSIHSNSDDGASALDFVKFTPQHCTSATIIGAPTFSADEDQILTMPFGSHAVFRERTTNEDRVLSVSGAPDGTPTYDYRDNGQAATYDAAARRWLAGYLPAVLMEAGLNIGPRIARWRAQGGIDNALEQIAQMTSSGAKRSHYEALVSAGNISTGDVEKIVISASSTLADNSGDMRAVLTRVAPRARLDRQGIAAVERAAAGMASGDKTTVLQSFGQTDDRDMLLSVMRSSESIASSGDRARLHQVLAARYLASDDKDLHGSYFDHAIQIPSSGDLRNTLIIATPYATKSTDIAQRIIEASRSVATSGDRSAVLIRVVSAGVVTTKELRDAFFNAVAEIPSEGDRSRVLQIASNLLR